MQGCNRKNMEQTIVQFDNMEQVREFGRSLAKELYKEMLETMRNDSRLLNAKEAAEALHISVSTLYRLEKRGVIDSVVIEGSPKRYRVCDIRWLASTPTIKQSLNI